MGLLGKSSRSLALWVTEVKLMKPDIIFHECTVKFNSDLLWQHLGGYDILHMKLSPIDFGWPAKRPRRGCCEKRAGDRRQVMVSWYRSCVYRQSGVGIRALSQSPDQSFLQGCSP